jgi:hypothetical protein
LRESTPRERFWVAQRLNAAMKIKIFESGFSR